MFEMPIGAEDTGETILSTVDSNPPPGTPFLLPQSLHLKMISAMWRSTWRYCVLGPMWIGNAPYPPKGPATCMHHQTTVVAGLPSS